MRFEIVDCFKVLLVEFVITCLIVLANIYIYIYIYIYICVCVCVCVCVLIC